MNQTTNKTQTTGSSVRTRHMVQTAIFGVIIVIMAFTPFLGYIPLGFTRATIIHIPVILASLLMGPKTGALLGLLFGLTSFITNTLLVMNLIYLFFKDTYAAANGVAVKAVYGFILSIIGINGVPEAIVAGVLTALIGRTLMKKNMKERLGFTHGFSD